MNRLLRLPIHTRLVLAFGVLVAVLLGVSAMAWSQLKTMRAATSQLTSNWLPSVLHVNELNTGTSDLRIAEFNMC